MKRFTLYYQPADPHSLQVLHFLQSKFIAIQKIDITDMANRKKLKELSGKEEIPALDHEDGFIFGADQITAHLTENFK